MIGGLHYLEVDKREWSQELVIKQTNYMSRWWTFVTIFEARKYGNPGKSEVGDWVCSDCLSRYFSVPDNCKLSEQVVFDVSRTLLSYWSIPWSQWLVGVLNKQNCRLNRLNEQLEVLPMQLLHPTTYVRFCTPLVFLKLWEHFVSATDLRCQVLDILFVDFCSCW